MAQLTSKELSTRLNEKGFKAEHEYYWVGKEGYFLPKDRAQVMAMTQDITLIPAYQFGELWAALPRYVNHLDSKFAYNLYMWKDANITALGYPRTKGHFEHPITAEAAGLLMEWCVDNKHVEVEG